jgi:predicted MFS family arabinose efflux permease
MILGGLSSRVDDVTQPERRPHARGLDAATYNVAEIAGPATGASITATLGVSFASVVLAAAALIASAVVVSITAARAGHEPSHGSVRQDLRAGLRAVLERPALRAVTAATCLASFGVGALTPTAVLLGIRAGHAAAGALLITAFGAGALAGSLLVARYPVKRWPAHRVALICLVGTGAALAVVAVAPPVWALSVVLFAIAGSFDGPLLSSLLEVRSAEAPAHLRTQVFTLGAGLKVSAASLGSAAFALVVGLPATLVLGLIAATHGIAAVLGALLLRTSATQKQSD